MCVLIRSVMSSSFVTPWTVALQVPLSLGILQARILAWVAMPSSRGSFQPRDRTLVSCVYRMASRFFTTEPLGKLIHTHTHTHTYKTYILFVFEDNVFIPMRLQLIKMQLF